MTDVSIIGAGPAGSIAAILLARQGHSVALIEQHRFPRDKVCGECLSAVGMDLLVRHRLWESLAPSRPVRLTRSELIAPSGAIASVDLPLPMWGISRSILDSTLIDQARDAGVEIVQPARCERIDPTSVTVRNLVTNESRQRRSKHMLIADGKAASGLAHPEPTKDLGIKAHFQNVQSIPNTIALFGLRGHYVGLAPVENSRWNVAMSVPSDRVRSFKGDLDALFAQLLTENTELANRFCHATRTSDWLASPLPRFAVASRWPEGIIPIGNAAAALEPIGGEGMGLAMRSAELAADAIDVALRNDRPVDTDALRQSFTKLWKTRRFAARATAMLMSRPRCAEILVAAMNSIESLARPALVPLGK